MTCFTSKYQTYSIYLPIHTRLYNVILYTKYIDIVITHIKGNIVFYHILSEITATVWNVVCDLYH